MNEEQFRKQEEQFRKQLEKIEKIQSKILANPNADGWIRLCEILNEAAQDKRIAASAGASAFLELMEEIASDSWTAATERDALAPLVDVFKIELEKSQRSAKAKFAANKRHEKTTIAKEEIRKIWATGKYSSRDICAEQECASLNIAFSTARKALQNTPEPT